MNIHRIGREISVLSDCLEVPGLGFLPVNAFVLHAAEPVVVDTGLGLPDRDFLAAVGEVLDPSEVRWIWLTHPDRDHTGGLFALLEAAPEARLVTTFVGVGILSCETPVPLDRVYLLNPGQSLPVGDRTLHAFRPPLWDNPATVGFYDDRTRACFSSDCFGGVMPTADVAAGDDAGVLAPADLRDSQLLWASVDSPWLELVDRDTFLTTVHPLRDMAPESVLSTHLPPAVGLLPALLDFVSGAPGLTPFVGPDQQALERMLAGFEPAAP
ncbi:MBL fold metallo-hydrolase [Kitasatospora cinereorecta]|uniref:MBL fold metallo-hydrolase n=1 Tax=Kitasatospora cinereorecta TaxID=285560 RepID=A0ABW0V5P0_9ACTN